MQAYLVNIIYQFATATAV